jgi:DNA mismatch endonuclease (patch repair protein)
MTDVLSPKQRSHCMAQIRGRDTKPEMKLRKLLWAAGCRYRLNSRLPGRPDIVVPRARVAIFVDGCFWHGCAQHFTWPKTRPDFWRSKLERNKARDKEVNKALRASGWKVIRCWEHELKLAPDRASRRILKMIASNELSATRSGKLEST